MDMSSIDYANEMLFLSSAEDSMCATENAKENFPNEKYVHGKPVTTVSIDGTLQKLYF